MDDWTKCYTHSILLLFDTANATELQDSSRVKILKTAAGYPNAGGMRDLFVEPENRDVLNDYNFSSLIEACQNIITQGLKPRIKTGNVPIKYSSYPLIGSFGLTCIRQVIYKK